MDDQLKSNLTSGEHWTRFIYMLLFSIFLYIASFLAAAMVVLQFIFALITGAPNQRLRRFGGEVVSYINQVWLFLTYNSEEKAYPFSDWPNIEGELENEEDAPESEVSGSEQYSPAEASVVEDSAPDLAATEPEAKEPASTSDDPVLEAEGKV